MEFFDGRYYKYNKILLTVIGQWPLSVSAMDRVILITIVSITSTSFLSKIFGLIMISDNIPLVLECLGSAIIEIGGIIKLTNWIIKKDKVILLLTRMEKEYPVMKSEALILSEFSETGRKYTALYAVVIIVSTIAYITMPFIPYVLENNGNDTDKPLTTIVYYFVDTQQYYYPIFVHLNVNDCIIMTVIVATDASLILFVQHCCGLFAIIGYRLEHLSENSSLSIELNPLLEQDESYNHVSKCVHLHKKAIEFADLIENIFSVSLFIEAGFNMLIISVTGIQAVENVSNPSELMRQFGVIVGSSIHLFFENYQGQQLLDSSEQLQTNLIYAHWYQTSFRTKKVLNFIIMRTHSPSVLTCAKMFPLNMDTFSTIVRMSMSYFTVLRSAQ